MKRMLLMIAGALALACGAADPKAGEACSPEGGVTCESGVMALECRGATFREVPCRGGGACVSDGSRTTCDNTTGARAGDGCFASQENQAACDSTNADQALKCTNGVMQALTCKGCLLQSGQVKCQG